MDKVKKLLEAYVQWLALAIGVAFLGWMVYGYVLAKPVSSTVGPTAGVAPGDVNHMIWDGPGQQLEAGINARIVPPHILPSTDYPEKVRERRAQVSPAVAMDLPVPFTPIPPAMDQGPVAPAVGPALANKIQSLPIAPPIYNLLVSGGHSNVAGPPVPQGAAPSVPVDRVWRTVEGTFPTVALAKAFKAVGIKAGTPVSNTCILRVVLERQERSADGTWPDDKDFTEIPPLEINQLDPLPPNNAQFTDQAAYIDYAGKNFTPIARPPFYQVLQGDVWYEPGTPNPNEAKEDLQNPFDPEHPENYTGDPNLLLPSEKAAYEAAKREQELKATRNQNQNRNPRPTNYPPGGFGPGGGPPGGPGGPGGRSPNGVAADPDRLAADFPRQPMLMPPNYPPPPGAFGPPGYPGRPPYMPSGVPGAPAAADNVVLPTGSFDPSQQAEFKVWAHDPTVQAGKTYRYRLRYIISNPVARTTGLCAPALAQQFSIVSQPSAWTDPVSVESDTNFYAVELKHGVMFEVFKWKDGVWQMQEVTANPGDMIGSTVIDPTTQVKTDFATGWTLVDIRENPSDTEDRTLVLVSNNGTVLEKQLKTDAHSPQFRKLWLQANQNKPQVAANPNT